MKENGKEWKGKERGEEEMVLYEVLQKIASRF